MAVVKALSFITHSTVVLAPHIRETVFNTTHQCVTEDRDKSHVTTGLRVKAANKISEIKVSVFGISKIMTHQFVISKIVIIDIRNIYFGYL